MLLYTNNLFENLLLFVNCIIVNKDKNGNIDSLSEKEWDSIYEYLFDGFDDIDKNSDIIKLCSIRKPLVNILSSKEENKCDNKFIENNLTKEGIIIKPQLFDNKSSKCHIYYDDNKYWCMYDSSKAIEEVFISFYPIVNYSNIKK
jgi:hypothetical protein